MTTIPLKIRTATAEDDLAAVRRLCWDYRAFLLSNSPEERQVVEAVYPETLYADLMDRLDRMHAPPSGSIRLVELHGAPVGCGMAHRIGPGIAEIKRVYVSDAARGHGAGRALCEALLDDIRSAGYERVMLDTSKSLTAARRLYEALGFRPRGPFYDVPPMAAPFLCFYEKSL